MTRPEAIEYALVLIQDRIEYLEGINPAEYDRETGSRVEEYRKAKKAQTLLRRFG